jgi:pyridoxine/pyridoxamine 5'-phosphate oxidase
MPACLTDALNNALSLLAEGAADPASPFHTPTLASIGADGAPAVRTVVLRGFANDARCLEMHTDTRSAKFVDFTGHSAAALHFWDAGKRVQIRLGGQIALHVGDQVAAAAWGKLRAASRATYCVQPGPGTPIAAPHDTHGIGEDAAFSVFCVMRMQFDVLEWLHLEHGSHARARFRWDNGEFTPMWLVP